MKVLEEGVSIEEGESVEGESLVSHYNTRRGTAERQTDRYDRRPALLPAFLLALHAFLPGVGGREVLALGGELRLPGSHIRRVLGVQVAWWGRWGGARSQTTCGVEDRGSRSGSAAHRHLVLVPRLGAGLGRVFLPSGRHPTISC